MPFVWFSTAVHDAQVRELRRLSHWLHTLVGNGPNPCERLIVASGIC
jgi:hypothetical protein